MKITNRTNEVLTYQTHHTAFPEGPITHEWISPGQSHNKAQGVDDVRVFVAPGKISGAQKGFLPTKYLISDAGPYPNTHEILLVRGGRAIVDWSAVKAKYLSGIKPVTANPDKSDPALEQGLACAAAIISACATGLGAMGPAGALPAGALQMLGSMIGLQTDPPPSPPNIDQIEVVVKNVVKTQSDLDLALSAATSFLRAQQWLVDQDAAFRDATENGGAGDLVPDFHTHLEEWAAGNRGFVKHIDDMCQSPASAKWIIPAFLAGVGAHLQIQRLHAVANHRRDRAAIEEFQQEVDRCREALLKTADAWRDYVLGRLREDVIDGTPEGTWASQTLTRAYVGADDVGPANLPAILQDMDPAIYDQTPIGSAVANLTHIHDYLDADLKAIANGESPTHFYKSYWEATASPSA